MSDLDLLPSLLIASALSAAGCVSTSPESARAAAPQKAEPRAWRQGELVSHFLETTPGIGGLGYVGEASTGGAMTFTAENLPAGFSLDRSELQLPETKDGPDRFLVTNWAIDMQCTSGERSDARLWTLFYDAQGQELGRCEFIAKAGPSRTTERRLLGPEGDQPVRRVLLTGNAPPPLSEGVRVEFDGRGLEVELVSGIVEPTEGGFRLSFTLENSSSAERDLLLAIRWLSPAGVATTKTERGLAGMAPGERRALTLTERARPSFPIQRVHLLVKAARPAVDPPAE